MVVQAAEAHRSPGFGASYRCEVQPNGTAGSLEDSAWVEVDKKAKNRERFEERYVRGARISLHELRTCRWLTRAPVARAAGVSRYSARLHRDLALQG